MSFSWVPFYREVAGAVLDYETRQDELLNVLREMQGQGLPTLPLEDDLSRDQRVPLTAIDPFTFMANFSRTGDDVSKRLCAWLKTRWSLSAPVPVDFDGRANVEPRASWFFTDTEDGRKAEDIPLLWQLARQVYDADASQLDQNLFRQVLQIRNIAIVKITTGLFWFSPKGFLPLTGPVLPYLKERGVEWDMRALSRGDLDEYRALMSRAHEVNFDNVALSREAWQWSKGIKPPPPQPVANLPLNLIRYGPPGTGKTYGSIAKAVEIISGEKLEGRAAKAEFDRLRGEGRIGFVTFHQSFAYEDFIEGIRPALDEESESGARYELRDGVLKQMALRALGESIVPDQPTTASFDEVWNALLDKIEADPNFEINGRSEQSRHHLVLVDDNIQGENILSASKNRFFVCYRDFAEQIWAAFPDKAEINGVDVRRAVPRIVGEAAFNAVIINELKRIAETVVLDPQTIARQFLANQIKAQYNANAPRFVLIVDEINRGNISKILGELITLLEEDKRLGRDNELRVTLPVSGETFGLPANLYILGTMNTADKSLALLDIALRRRFSFEEVRPDFKICSDLTDEMRRVLDALNERLMLVLDREHRLGHAFFMGVTNREEFNAVFESKIVPLLQEFFYNDWDGLRAVLGEATKSDAKGRMVRTLANLAGARGRTRYAWWYDVGDPTPDFLQALGSEVLPAPALDDAANTPDDDSANDAQLSDDAIV